MSKIEYFSNYEILKTNVIIEPQGKIQKKIENIGNIVFSHPVIILLILLLCWILCYLSVFLGNFHYDAKVGFNQSLYWYHGDFPRLHLVLISGYLTIAYNLTGSYNVGIALFTIVQMIFLAASFTYILYEFYNAKANKV